MSKLRKCFRIQGRVQGVSFRANTQAQAVALQLSGWVRNCSDGSVETAAEGTPQAMAEFEKWLQKGPRWAEVKMIQELERSEVETGQLPLPFEIRY